MTLRPFGRTGLSVSRLGLGLAAVGRPGYITLGRARDLPATRTPDALAARTAELCDAAWASGIRYFDVARSYGRAEEFLARWLTARTVASDAVTVGSKWGYRYTADWSVDATVHEDKPAPALARCERFIEQLSRRFGLPVARVDERYSSIDADTIHRERRHAGFVKRAKALDDVAAEVILQRYLDALPDGQAAREALA